MGEEKEEWWERRGEKDRGSDTKMGEDMGEEIRERKIQ